MHKWAATVFLLLPLFTLAFTPPGTPTGYVSDYAGLLSPGVKAGLEATLSQFTQETGSEIAIVTIPSLPSDESIETYATQLFEEWGIGNKEVDNGLLLLISRDDRKMRVEVGYGLEHVITDIESAHIIRDILTPQFQAGNFDQGVTEAVTRLIEDIRTGTAGEYTAPKTSFPVGDIFYLGVFLVLALGSWLGSTRSWWAGGVLGGVVGLFVSIFVGLVYTGLLAITILIPLGLLFDFVASKLYHKHKGPDGTPPWFFGGGRGGRGGGFGGFGGGMSGGGGASGNW